MDLRQIIEAEKNVHSYGEWRYGKIPKAVFPLRKRKLQQSNDWQWRLIKFTALNESFVILLRLNQGKQEYYAILGHMRDDGMAIICSHDLHITHKNWHCHFVPGDVRKVMAGVLRDREKTICFPSGRGEVECTTKFNVTDSNAISIAAKRYRFPSPSQGELEV